MGGGAHRIVGGGMGVSRQRPADQQCQRAESATGFSPDPICDESLVLVTALSLVPVGVRVGAWYVWVYGNYLESQFLVSEMEIALTSLCAAAGVSQRSRIEPVTQ